MVKKSLEDKAIDIKGKKYVLVSDRVIYFNEHYPEGAIVTELVSGPESQTVIVKATIYPSVMPKVIDEAVGNWAGVRRFTGYSQAVIGDGFINKTAALENAETSAVGRALAMMGIGVIDSIASVDEINKAAPQKVNYATPKQIKWMRDTARENEQLAGDSDKEVDLYIETILTIPPQKVPVFKVKDAVDKIKSVDQAVIDELREDLRQDGIDLERDGIPY